jgi:membrane protein
MVNDLSQSTDLIQIDTLWLLNRLEKSTIFVLLSLAMMVLFKILPSTLVAWGDVWLGALISVNLFLLLQYLVSNSIFQIGNQFLSYGVFGSMMVLLLWIYLTCQLFFLGSEFTYVYAHLFGSRRQKKAHNQTISNQHDP